jgi:hypothetical protein
VANGSLRIDPHVLTYLKRVKKTLDLCETALQHIVNAPTLTYVSSSSLSAVSVTLCSPTGIEYGHAQDDHDAARQNTLFALDAEPIVSVRRAPVEVALTYSTRL